VYKKRRKVSLVLRRKLHQYSFLRIVVSVLKMVKLFGWENKMLNQIQDARNDELKSVLKLKVLESLTGILKYADIFVLSEALSLINFLT
jgi:hypothetical protein